MGEVANRAARELSAEDDAKLVFGTVFSLRNMVRKLGGEDDRWVCAWVEKGGGRVESWTGGGRELWEELEREAESEY